MSKTLTAILRSDHEEIKKKIKATERESSKATNGSARERFNEMMDFILAHAKCEERVLYRKFEEADSVGSNEELQEITLESFEEHTLVEDLLKKMDQTEVDATWKAKLAVVHELLEHHIEEEEEEYFPKVEKRLEKQELIDLGAIYESERDLYLEGEMKRSPSHRSSEIEPPSEAVH